MAPDPTIVVTGATGRVGGRVLAHLQGAGAAVRAVARNGDRLAAVAHRYDAVPVTADLTDPTTLDRAVAGADAVFLVFPSVTGDHAAAATVASLAARARRIVYLSAHGSEAALPGSTGIMGSHALVEQLVRRSGAEWTFLRASGFAANTLGWAPQIRNGNTLRWIFPSATRALVHEDDLGAVAAAALLDDGSSGHVGAAHHLTGPEALTQERMLGLIGDVLGRPLRFEDVGVEAAADLFPGASAAMVASIVEGQRALVAAPEPVSDTVEALLGRPARSFARWARDHVEDFAHETGELRRADLGGS